MPYVSQGLREKYAQVVQQFPEMLDSGALNYLVTMLAKEYLVQHGRRYETMNAVVGALECAKAEFYRRIVAPYENNKIAINGDVY